MRRVFTSAWFWRRLHRYNALVIAALGSAAIVVGGLAVAGAVFSWFAPRAVQVAPVSEERRDPDGGEVVETLQELAPLGATGLYFGAVVAEPRLRLGGLRSAYGSKAARNQLDWLIYDPRPDGAPPRHLIGARPALLISARLLEWRAAPTEPAQPLAIFARYVLEDTTGDGLLTARDRQITALAAPNGGALTPLEIEGAFVDLEVISAREALLVTETDAGAVVTHLDLAARAVGRRVAVDRP